MAKVRAERAAELLALLERGPHFGRPGQGEAYTKAEAQAIYRIWSQTWVLDELKALVPELRKRP